MITLAEAKELQRGDILIDERGRRWKVNGQVKRWKRDPNRIRVPLKHGLYAHDALEDTDFSPRQNGKFGDDRVCNVLTKEQ